MISKQARRFEALYKEDRVSTTYEARNGTKLWRTEEEVLRECLEDLPVGTTLLDIPVGTGRFLRFYDDRGFITTGLDLSPQMLREARKKGALTDLGILSIFELSTANAGLFDVVVSVRMAHLFTDDDFRLMMQGLQAVARKRIVYSVRLGAPRDSALLDDVLNGWRIVRKTVVLGDWHMIMMEPAP